MKGKSRTGWHLSMQGPHASAQTCREAEDGSSLAGDAGRMVS